MLQQYRGYDTSGQNDYSIFVAVYARNKELFSLAMMSSFSSGIDSELRRSRQADCYG